MEAVKTTRFIFVGERPSKLAAARRWSWTDGRLAAKQLFDGLRQAGIDPDNDQQVRFANVWQRAGDVVPDHNLLCKLRVEKQWIVVGMGAKVQAELTSWGVTHLPMIHPAARGSIRKKDRWCAYVCDLFKDLP